MLKILSALLLVLALPALAETPRRMVVAAHPAAAQAGLDVLRQGGNAVDAAVAVQMVLSVVEPQATGIGGGGFLLRYDGRSHAVSSWDGREAAPAASGPNLFLQPDGQPMPFLDAVIGGRSVGVPGIVRMLEAVHRRHGHLPWAELVQPAIRLAENGFPVSPRLAQQIARDAPNLARRDAARALFLHADGSPLLAGETLVNKAQAATLRAVAENGADALLRGPIAADIAAAIRTDANPGLMTTDDLAAYTAIERAPVCGTYRGLTLCSMGPPSSGGIAVLQTLGLLGHFDMAGLDPGGIDAAHLLIEAERLAFADRDLYVADPAFVRMPVAGLLDPAYLSGRAQLIDPDHAAPGVRAGNPRWPAPASPAAAQPTQPEHGTSHVAIVDADGDAVSMTSTVEDAFGSRLLVDGVLLNNELTDFSLRPELDGRAIANRVEAGKRPRSAMAPFIVLNPDGSLHAAVGSAGGAGIIGYVAQALVALVDWHLAPEQVAALPRVVSIGQTAIIEAGTAAERLLPVLEQRGQRVRAGITFSGTSIVLATPDGPVGAGDPRKEGTALGD